MANKKISQLTTTTTADDGSWLVMNDSGNTTTYKITRENLLSGTTTPPGMVNGSGTDTIQSASFLTSQGTTASTSNSIAIGVGAEATSPYSIAIGYNARNNNRDGTRNNYIVIGKDAQAVQESFALGTNARALGASTCSVGENALSLGNSSYALGKNTYTTSTGGIAIGNGATDQANNYGYVIGSSNNNTDYSVVIGYASASVDYPYQVVIGYNSTALHEEAVVLGKGINSQYSATTHTNHTHTMKTESYDVVSGGSVSGNVVVDCSLGSIFTFTLGGNITQIDFQNLRTGQRLEFIIDNTTYNVTGSALIDGVSGYVYSKNGTITPSNNSITHYTATYDGTRLFLDEEGQFSVV